MTFLVPYDDSPLSRAALSRAVQFATIFDEPVTAVTVIPNGNAEYARDRGWIGDGDAFDLGAIRSHLRDQVADVAPDAAVETSVVDRYAPPGTVVRRLRKAARDHDTTMVFVGSDDAGGVVSSLGSVGGRVAAGRTFDVVIVRSKEPPLAIESDTSG